MGPASGGVARAKREKRARVRKGKMRERVEGTWGWMVRGGRRSTGWNKGDETVGVCNCSGFNALLMADGTQDWGNGLHQMSLLVREEGKRERERKKRETLEKYSKRHWECRRHVESHRFFRHWFCVLVPSPIDISLPWNIAKVLELNQSILKNIDLQD